MAAKKTEQETAIPADPQAALTASFKKLDEVLKALPKEKVEEARRAAEEILKGDMSWVEIMNTPPERLWQMAETGYNQFQLGRYDKAEIIFKGLTVIDPDNYYFHQMLGATFQRMEKLPEAVVEYAVALDINPKDIVSLTNRGEIYFKLGALPLADKDIETAIALDEKKEDRWANRARMLARQIEVVKKGKKEKH